MDKLGAVALSGDILTKANIGLWAFELDEGSAPRMYADEAMRRLLGIDKGLSPEETYHAWYDRIDPEHYAEVTATVEKMTAGVHAEAQYPWHHPNGETWIVRCGGVRNYAYKKGIRLEGTHQNVTEVAHFQKVKLGTIALDQDILKKASIGLWAFELDEGSAPRMYADETMRRLIGLDTELSPEETYHAWYDHIDPDHYGEVGEAVEKMTAGVHAEVQYPWHHPNGETWIVRCGGVRNYAYSKGIRIEGTHQDVTSLDHLEKKNLADLLASLAGNFRQVYFLDPYTGKVRSFAGTFKGDEDRDFSKVDFYADLAEKNKLLKNTEDLKLVEEKYAPEHLISLLESGQRDEFTVLWPETDERGAIYMKNCLVPFEDSDGIKKLVIGVTDVTEEKKAEQALAERNTYLAHFLNAFHSAYLVDLLNGSFEILHMEEDFAGVFVTEGGSADMAAFIDDHIHPDDRALMRRMSDRFFIREELKKRAEISFTVREIFDGEERTVRVLILRGADDTRAAIGFMDITDQIAAEKEYVRKVEAASRAKATFLFNMSHDIRTPMNAIIGFNDMALRHPEDKETVEDCLKKIKIGSSQLLSLINDVLDMARIESGSIRCEYAPADISECVEEFAGLVEKGLDKPLTFETDLSGLTHTLVLADRFHTERILMNVLANSVKFTPEGGRVRFTGREEPASRPGYRACVFTIEDNGIGMSEEFLSHIFEEFSREKNSTRSGVQGTGLGMSITKKLLDLLGGTIEIKSRLGEGTVTVIRLELQEAGDMASVKKAKEQAALTAEMLRGRRVLLVEDNELNREIAADLLEEAGMEVDTAEDGDIAVEMVSASEPGRYELILMDIQMPRMNGYEATRAIRALPSPQLARIPIVAMTANTFEEDKQNAFAAGMNGHVGKPVDHAKLLKTLTELMK